MDWNPDSILAAMREPLNASEVKWRVGSMTQDKTRGMALAYVDARAVMDRLDNTVGPQNWQDSYHHIDGRTFCTIQIRECLLYTRQDIHSGYTGWIGKTDGAGDTSIEGEKGSISDAFKRAAVKWGIGRELYALDAPWVALQNKRIPDHELSRLANLLGAPAPAAPEKQRMSDMTEDEYNQASQPQANTTEPSELNSWIAEVGEDYVLSKDDYRRWEIWKTAFRAAETAYGKEKIDKENKYDCMREFESLHGLTFKNKMRAKHILPFREFAATTFGQQPGSDNTGY